MKLSTLGAVTAAFAVCAAAGAQTKGYQQIGVDARFGAFIPTNKTTIDELGGGFFAFGVDYSLSLKTPNLLGYKSHAALSVDYFRRDDIGNIPVLLNYIATSGQYFAQIGAGVGFASLPGEDKTTFSYDLGIGYTLPVNSTLPLFAQATFFGSDRSRINGVGVYVGIRF